ncbi:Inner membrane protein yijD [Raoultella terrigena]|uniref:Inner membrane protein yijD n=1 Tax=Raoultella terrigena TaxID=577 RepID=A0A4U9DAH5_RAOTE|nr:Inner membrane protein yijD [Raoultella terrigena]
MKHSVQDKGTLLLALIAGLSINGTFAALFSSDCSLFHFPGTVSAADGLLSAPALSEPEYARGAAGSGCCLFHSRGSAI